MRDLREHAFPGSGLGRQIGDGIHPAPHQADHRQHQDGHAEGLVPCQRLQLGETRGKLSARMRDHPLVDDQQHDDPMQRLGERTPGARGVTKGHVGKLAARKGQGQSHGDAGTHHEYIAIGARFPLGSVGLVLLGLAACQTSPPQQAPPARPAAAGCTRRARSRPGARKYQVVPAESLLQILVYRGGAMARLGHNHVIASHQLSGRRLRDRRSVRQRASTSVSRSTSSPSTSRHCATRRAGLSARRSAERARRERGTTCCPRPARRARIIRRSGCAPPTSGPRARSIDVGVEVTLKGATHLLRVPVHGQAPGRRNCRQRRVPAEAVGAGPQAVQRGDGRAGGARRDARPLRSRERATVVS